MARHGVEQQEPGFVRIQTTRTFSKDLAIDRASLEAALHNPALMAAAHIFRGQLDKAPEFDNG